MRERLLTALVIVVSGCYRYYPPLPPPVRDARAVYASFGETWDAVIDVFAEQNIPISTMERASGFIAAERTSWRYASLYERDYVLRLVDCGRLGPVPYLPSAARYNVVVRGDSSVSTVKVTTTYTSTGTFYTDPTKVKAANVDCSSRGVFEDSVEATIKDQAERRAGLTGPVRTAGRPVMQATAPAAPAPNGTPSQAGARLLNVTVRMRFIDPDSTVTPIPSFEVAVVNERGDTTRAITNAFGVAALALPAGRYRAVPPKRAEFDGRVYTWDVSFTVYMGMGPVDLTQRNARRQ
jgi:hypothetical protein